MKHVGLSKVRWQGKRHFTTENGNMLIYSGPEQITMWCKCLAAEDCIQSSHWIQPYNDRIMTVRLNVWPVNITPGQVYAPTSIADEAEIETFYEYYRTY